MSTEKKIRTTDATNWCTSLLKEAKAIVDGAPKAIKEKVSKAEAEDIQKKLTEAGAKVEVK